MVVFNSKLLLANIYGRLTRLTAAFGIYQWPGKATGETPAAALSPPAAAAVTALILGFHLKYLPCISFKNFRSASKNYHKTVGYLLSLHSCPPCPSLPITTLCHTLSLSLLPIRTGTASED